MMKSIVKAAVPALTLTLVLACAIALPEPMATKAAAEPSLGVSNSKVVIVTEGGVTGYLPAKDPKLTDIRERLQKRKLLEEFKDFLAPIRLPKTLRLAAMECPGSASPFYSFTLRVIVMCYQFVNVVDQIATALVNAHAKGSTKLPRGITFTRQEVVAGVITGVMLHELGHALFDILDVPMFGREEDAADQLANYLALQFNPEVARTVVKGTALVWLAIGDPPTKMPAVPQPKGPLLEGAKSSKPGANIRCDQHPICAYSDNHGTGSQRMYNTLCLGVGRDPVLFKDFVEHGWLPHDRAVHCPGEYQQVKWAFERTIMPFIDEGIMRKVQARNWFIEGEVAKSR